MLAKNGQTVGIGGGQPNRVDSVRIAIEEEQVRGNQVLHSHQMLSSLSRILWKRQVRAGITAIVHPGGSLRDQESIDAADRLQLPWLRRERVISPLKVLLAS